jgi:hypothetical protein
MGLAFIRQNYSKSIKMINFVSHLTTFNASNNLRALLMGEIGPRLKPNRHGKVQIPDSPLDQSSLETRINWRTDSPQIEHIILNNNKNRLASYETVYFCWGEFVEIS